MGLVGRAIDRFLGHGDAAEIDALKKANAGLTNEVREALEVNAAHIENLKRTVDRMASGAVRHTPRVVNGDGR